MSRFVVHGGGRWWSRPVCWLTGLWDTVRLGALPLARVDGHRWRETPDSRWPGQHLRCDECGREALEYETFDREERT